MDEGGPTTMPTGLTNRLLEELRRVAVHAAGECRTDGQLLECFITQREEAAFAALVRRHGPMVLGVCRRLLRHTQDAEDAFQATFLVLVRKAASVRPREAVGNWLYGVAYRTALRARGRLALRRAKERQVRDVPRSPNPSEELWRELQPLLDRELSRLSDKYRLPVVLCDLGGRSRKEVARQLAIPEGTLSSRLAMARRLLAKRLARYGLALPGGVLAAALAENGASAGVPAALLLTTTRAALLVAAGPAAGLVSAQAVALTEGVLRTMLWVKLKTAAAVLFGLSAVGLGTGGLLYQARAGAAGPNGVARAQPAEQQKDRVLGDSLRSVAQGASERERALREQLEQARREVEELRAEAARQRDRAEAERRRAEAVLREAEERLRQVQAERAAARRDAEKLLYARSVQQAQQELSKAAGGGPQGQRKAPENDLASLEERKAQLLREFEARRNELTAQLRELEVRMREEIAAMERQRENLSRQKKAPPSQGSAPAHPTGDKLDQILQRLERLERRLDNLERK
jgi:RNA polymerase sigma factor (sigma-70 family)